MENNLEKQMDLRAGLSKVIQEWPNETKKPFSDNPLAKFIRSELTNIIGDLTSQYYPYKIKASAGAGNWELG